MRYRCGICLRTLTQWVPKLLFSYNEFENYCHILTDNELTQWPLGNLNVIFKKILVIDGWGNSCEIALIWMSLDFTDDQSTLVQVMAWCHQATSHYLRQCWPSFMSSYGVTRPQWVKCDTAQESQWHSILCSKRRKCPPYILQIQKTSDLLKHCSFPISSLSPSHIPSRWNLISQLNSLWPSDAIWQQRSGSTMVQVMACYLMAPSHYLNQCWLTISEVQWHSY